MGRIYETIDPHLRDWIGQQKVFFVATAPLDAAGHVNCSPKGGDFFRVLGDREVAYLDLTGSGIETVAHLQENSRIVIMFCAFMGAPKIVRLHGNGSVIYPDDPTFAEFAPLFPAHAGARAIIKVNLERISDSCGHGVPYLHFAGNRDVLDRWTDQKGPDGLAAYRTEKNRISIDGIAGYKCD